MTIQSWTDYGVRASMGCLRTHLDGVVVHQGSPKDMINLWVRFSIVVLGNAFSLGMFLGLVVLVGCDSGSAVRTDLSVMPALTAEELRAAAEKGDPDAMVGWARALMEGGREKSAGTQAVMWAERAAQHGNAEAEWLLSELYEAGRGVARSDAISLEWAKRAADRGHVDAAYAVGIKYATGRGVMKDKEASVMWLGRASTQGMALAQFNLAQRLEHGEGTTSNLAAAWAWYRVAAEEPGGILDAEGSAERVHRLLSSEQRQDAGEEWKRLRSSIRLRQDGGPPRSRRVVP